MPVNDLPQAPKYPRVGEQRAESRLGLQQALKNKQQHCKQGLKHSLEEQTTPQRADWGCNNLWKEKQNITDTRLGSYHKQQHREYTRAKISEKQATALRANLAALFSGKTDIKLGLHYSLKNKATF